MTLDPSAHEVFSELYDKHASPKIQSNIDIFDSRHIFEDKDALLDIKPGETRQVNSDQDLYKSDFIFTPKLRNSNSNGVLVSLDGRFEHKLVKKQKLRSSKPEIVILPPGGVARFDVTLTAPPADVLKSGISKFIATGLEIRTDEEVIPIAASYESVQGQLLLAAYNISDHWDTYRNDYEVINNMWFSPTDELNSIFNEYDRMGNDAVRAGKTFFSLNINYHYTHKKYMHNSKLVRRVGRSGDFSVLDMAPLYKVIDVNRFKPNTYKSYSDSSDIAIVGSSGRLRSGPALDDAFDVNKNDPYIDLMVTSTFPSEVVIASVTSCSPWFNVIFKSEGIRKVSGSGSWPVNDVSTNYHRDMFGTSPNPYRGQAVAPPDVNAYSEFIEPFSGATPIARVYHTLTCDNLNFTKQKDAQAEMTFWGCAWKFIENKALITPKGCAPEIKAKASNAIEANVEKNALAAVSSFVEHMYTSTNSLIMRESVQRWEAAVSAWTEYSRLGLNIAATSISAIPVSATETASPPLLVQSKLEIPRVQLSKYPEVVFEDTNLGEASVGWVYVENPTGSEIAFSLTSSELDEEIWIQNNPLSTNSWFTGGGWIMTEKATGTPVLQAGYGRTAHNPDAGHSRSVHGISLLLRGCGRRCAVKGEGTSPTSLFAPIVPTSTENEEGTLYRITKPHTFAISYDAWRPKMVEAYGVTRLGPIFFKPWGDGDHVGGLYIRNEISGLERVTLLGRGITSHLTFDDAQPWLTSAPSVVNYGGKSMLKFAPGTTFDKASTKKKVRIGNYGGGTVAVESFYLSSINAARQGRNWGLSKGFGASFLPHYITMPFPSYGPSSSDGNCQSREFEIVDCELAKTGFVLGPDEHIDIEIAHWPTCEGATMLSSLTFNMIRKEVNWETVSTEGWIEGVSILVGYVASESTLEHCISSNDVFKYDYRLLSLWLVCLIFFTCLTYLYFISLDVLYRHDYMLRFEETWYKPMVCSFNELQLELGHITITNPDVWALEKYARGRALRGIKKAEKSSDGKLLSSSFGNHIFPNNFFGELESGREGSRSAKKAVASPLGVNLDYAKETSVFSAKRTREFEAELTMGTCVTALLKCRGSDIPKGRVSSSEFCSFLAHMNNPLTQLKSEPREEDRMGRDRLSSSLSECSVPTLGKDLIDAIKPTSGKVSFSNGTKGSPTADSNKNNNNAGGNSGFENLNKSLSKEERRAIAAEQQRAAVSEKAERKREAEKQQLAALNKKKEVKAEAARRKEEEEKKREEELEMEELRAQKEAIRQRSLAAESALAESLRAAKAEAERVAEIERKKKELVEEERLRIISKEEKRLAGIKAAREKEKEKIRKNKEDQKRLKEEQRKLKEKQEKLKKEQDAQVKKVKEFILTQKGVAEVQWLISMSGSNDHGIKGLFTSPSDVARFCILNSEFELRREANMDFMVMKAMLPKQQPTPPRPLPASFTPLPQPNRPLPLPLPPPGLPPGINTASSSSALPLPPLRQQISPIGTSTTASPTSTLPYPPSLPSLSLSQQESSTKQSSIIGSSGLVSGANLPSLESLLAGGSSLPNSQRSSSNNLAHRSSSGVSSEDDAILGTDLLGGSDNFNDMMDLLPTDIADVVVEGNSNDMWNTSSSGSASGGLGGLGGLPLVGGSSLLTPSSLMTGLDDVGNRSSNPMISSNKKESPVKRSGLFD